MTAFDWDNDEWSEKLAGRFFSPAFAGEPVTFAADARTLAEITNLSEADAIEALAAHVREQVMPGHRFTRVRARADVWATKGCPGPPPSLPLLALTVVAASGMSRFNFYVPLRRLLDPADEGEGVPGDFAAAVPRLWKQLGWWLDEHLEGSRGLSTIVEHPHFVNIGYSLQQAILRASDRTLLYRFFRAIGLEPSEATMAPAELRRALALWSSRQGPRAQRLNRLATDPMLDGLAEAVLARSAELWDGRLRDPKSGSKAVTLRLVLEHRPFKLGIAAPRLPEGPTSVEVTGADADGEGAATPLTGNGTWYEPAPLPIEVSPGLLDEGCELSGPELSFFYDPRDAVPFRFDDDLSEWVSEPRFTYGEKHHLLVRGPIRASVQQWLRAEGLEGDLDPSATARLPEGWFLFRAVRLNARPAHEPPPGIGELLPTGGGGARTRLVGGLKILGLRGAYLTGGVPNVAFPDSSDAHRFELRHAGFEPIERTTEDHEFHLGSFHQLEAGEYEIVSGDTTLPFSLIESLLDTPGPDVGYLKIDGGTGRGARGYCVDGPGPKAPVTVAASEKGTILLGASPDSVEVAKNPVWVTDLAGYLSWVNIDAWDHDGDEPVWALVPGDDGKRHARALRIAPPQDGAAGARWASFVLRATLDPGQGSDVEEQWQRYREAAEALA